MRIYLCSFFFKTLWIATVFPHMVFFSFFMIVFFFFQNSLCRFYFFHIELVENLVSWFFFIKNTVDCYSVPPHDFFLLWFFSKLSLSILLFLILSWLRITTVDFLMKHYRLLQCFHACFFSLSVFFYDFFQNFLCSFNFLNINLVENLAL